MCAYLGRLICRFGTSSRHFLAGCAASLRHRPCVRAARKLPDLAPQADIHMAHLHDRRHVSWRLRGMAADMCACVATCCSP